MPSSPCGILSTRETLLSGATLLLYVGRRDVVLVLVALGKVAGRRESYLVGNFGYGLVGGLEQLSGSLETDDADDLDRRLVGDRLALAIELHAAHVHLIAEIVDRKVCIAHIGRDEIL